MIALAGKGRVIWLMMWSLIPVGKEYGDEGVGLGVVVKLMVMVVMMMGYDLACGEVLDISWVALGWVWW